MGTGMKHPVQSGPLPTHLPAQDLKNEEENCPTSVRLWKSRVGQNTLSFISSTQYLHCTV